MSTKKWVAAVLAVVIASPFAVAALDAIGIGPNWEVDVAEWESGYSWTYDTSLAIALEGYDPEETHSMDLKAEGDHIYSVANTTAAHGNVSLYAVLEQFVPTKVSEGDEIFYEQDVEGDPGTPVDPTMTPQMCLAQCFGAHSYFTHADLNPYYQDAWMNPMQDDELELRFLDFPLKPGASWTVYRTDYPVDLPGIGDPYEQLDAHVAGRDHVNLPGIGTMEAIRIEAALTEDSKSSFQRAFDEIPAEFGSVDFDMDYTMTYWYSPEAKNIVRSDLHQMQDVSAQFQGESLSMSMSIDSSSILSDHNLEALPERSVEETNKLQDFVKDLPDVTELSNKTWPFSLAADHFSVNVVDEERVNLGILEGDRNGETTTTDFDEIPEGLNLKWRHRYVDVTTEAEEGWVEEMDPAPVEEWYSGDSLQLTPQSQGLHEITAYLLDEEGRLVGLDSTMIEGYARWGLQDEGYQGLLVGTPLDGSNELGFVGNLFLDHVLVEVDPGQVASGTLMLERIYMEEGDPRSESKMVSGPDSIRMDSTYPGSFSLWRAEHHDQVRVGALEMTATVRYDRNSNFSDTDELWDKNAEGASALSDLVDDECSLMFASCALDMMLGGYLEPQGTRTEVRLSGPLG